ncbi:hypothetical protein ACSDR0_42425 [Streptosporangium sp. G11]|uniref:hypothetical protein n=1 Tax=Streptosporangium sp. G11 TaxID=3436926 RepID=UPI003EBE58D7
MEDRRQTLTLKAGEFGEAGKRRGLNHEGGETMTSRFAQWTLDVHDSRKMAAFWSAACGEH